MNERFKEFVDFLISSGKVKSYADFARHIGRNRSQVSQMFSGKRKLNDRTLSIILHHYPELNPIWISKGEGDMLIPDKEVNTNSNDNVNNNGNKINLVNKVDFGDLDIRKKKASKSKTDKMEEDSKLILLKARIAELETKLKDEQALSEKYWTMIQQLTIK